MFDYPINVLLMNVGGLVYGSGDMINLDIEFLLLLFYDVNKLSFMYERYSFLLGIEA